MLVHYSSATCNSSNDGTNRHASAELILWDPYYCDGGTERMLNDIEYMNVVHENVDFYGLITRGDIPRHDALVTNPPYSEDHIRRLLDYVVNTEIPIHERPVCLLLPNWVSRKAEYESTFVAPLTSMGFELLYLGPLVPYMYAMPSSLPWRKGPITLGRTGKRRHILVRGTWSFLLPSRTLVVLKNISCWI